MTELNTDTVLAEILNEKGEVLRVVETTRARASEKGWRLIKLDLGAQNMRFDDVYNELQSHEKANAARAKVESVLRTLEYPAEYCQKTAFIAYINEPERAQ